MEAMTHGARLSVLHRPHCANFPAGCSRSCVFSYLLTALLSPHLYSSEFWGLSGGHRLHDL